ncbi:MAG TPA: hypothetical protein VKQ36_02235, partial [Ktedonobacterales bacterium]|nr:hypothetical protein [Ktedonobacterales bacterium]
MSDAISDATRKTTRDIPGKTPGETTPAAPPLAPTGLLRTARSRVLLAVGLLALILVFFLGGDNWLLILNVTMIAAIATLSLNVLSGYTGQISLGITFFMGIGAYISAWLGGPPPTFPGDPIGLNLSFLIWLPAAGIGAALVGALVGPTALRLKGFYLAI